MADNKTKIEFTGSLGDPLAARLELPVGTPRAFAIFAHCFTCSKDVFAASRISAGLAERGIAVLRFDFTGLGASGGDFANTNFSSNVEDLVAAAVWLRENYQAPSLLVGHSFGGAAVLAAAGEVDEVKAVVTVGAPADPDHVAHLIQSSREEIDATGEAEVMIAGRNFTVRKQFLENIASQNLSQRIGNLGKALLVVHAPRDEFVGIENASAIFSAAKHPKSYLSLDDADHLLSDHAHSAYAADVISAWASRYIDQKFNRSDAEPALEDAEWIVFESGDGGFAQTITNGTHRLRADEPPSVGGGDTGPTPYGLLSAALGACTSMTIRMYANRKKIPLEWVGVRLNHKKVHATDCEECEATEGKIDRLDREIELRGDLTDE